MKCAVKFCGGCNPRYDRGAAYGKIKDQTKEFAGFEVAKEGTSYDALMIIRGCTQCPYLYEEFEAKERFVSTSQEEADAMPERLRSYAESR